jgi:mRNA interferase HigB
MHVISKKRLRTFWEVHPQSEAPLRAWYQVATKANWECLDDIRQVFPRTDRVGRCFVFNIGGNRYRLVVTASFKYGKLYVRSVMPHAEYSKSRWKEECLCS